MTDMHDEQQQDEGQGRVDRTAARRAGRREANLRALNERIASSRERLSPADVALLTLLCECAFDGCDETIRLTHEEFGELRGHETRFAVVDGHVLHDVESVLARGDGWIIVKKHGEAAREASRNLS